MQEQGQQLKLLSLQTVLRTPAIVRRTWKGKNGADVLDRNTLNILFTQNIRIAQKEIDCLA